jgi:hypothetical protein
MCRAPGPTIKLTSQKKHGGALAEDYQKGYPLSSAEPYVARLVA